MKVVVKLRGKPGRIIERALIGLGLLLLAVCSAAYLHRTIMVREEMERFNQAHRQATQSPSVAEAPNFASLDDITRPLPDVSNRGTLGRNADPGRNSDPMSRAAKPSPSGSAGSARQGPLAILRIPAIHLEVPVLNGTDAVTLNRGVGRIPGTAFPGQAGNLAIAGHRDGFFRGLKDVHTGDRIELVTTNGTEIYTVEVVLTTNPDDLSVLESHGKAALTLVTCYPFHYIGSAPRRFVVEASRQE